MGYQAGTLKITGISISALNAEPRFVQKPNTKRGKNNAKLN